MKPKASASSFSVSQKQAMCEWSERNPRNKHGSHAYSAEKFGTTDDAIRARFAKYIDRFAPLLA